MNFIFISPHFPPNFQQFVKALRSEGVNTLGIGDAPFHALSHELRGALNEYYHAPDLNEYDAMYRAVAHFASKYGKIGHIESMNEHWLDVEARLRADFNVPGPKPEDLDRTRRKLGMKDIFKRHGIPCAEGERIADPKQLEAFVSRVGYPVIIKPDIGAGAKHIHMISSAEELKPHLERLPQNCLIEKFIQGDPVSFDGLTDEHGRILFCTSMQINAGIVEIINRKLEMHYWFRRAIPAALEELGRKTVAAFGLRERFFHMEFFKEAADRYSVLSINVRPPAGFSVDMMNFQCDFDLYRIYAHMVATREQPASVERKYNVAHAARRHGRAYRHSHDALVYCLGNRLMAHLPVPEVFSAEMGNYTYLIRDPDEAALRQAIGMVQERG